MTFSHANAITVVSSTIKSPPITRRCLFPRRSTEKTDIMSNKNKGFSLIELIVTVTIMTVLTAILAPQMLGYVREAHQKACTSSRFEFVRYYQRYIEDEDGAESLPDFLSEAKFMGLDSDNICPAGGTCAFAIVDKHLSVLCSVHDTDTGAGTAVKPASGPNNTFVLDPATGKYAEIVVHGTGVGQTCYAIDDKIIYYDGDKYEKGYYYINAAKTSSAPITDMDAYITTILGWGANNLVKINTDVPIQTYDAVSQNALKQADRNSMIVQGQCYYIDFDWDTVDGPVLAMYTGLTNATYWRKDLSKADNGTAGNNIGVWAILETK